MLYIFLLQHVICFILNFLKKIKRICQVKNNCIKEGEYVTVVLKFSYKEIKVKICNYQMIYKDV